MLSLTSLTLEPVVELFYHHGSQGQWNVLVITIYLPQISPSIHFIDQPERERDQSGELHVHCLACDLNTSHADCCTMDVLSLKTIILVTNLPSHFYKEVCNYKLSLKDRNYCITDFIMVNETNQHITL